MICLTGDIHHSGLRTGNQLASDVSEIELAIRAMEMVLDHDIRLTYFMTGKLTVEAPLLCRRIGAQPSVEVGGHNYWCFQPQLLHRIWNAATGEYAGPLWLQRLDTRRTIDAIEKTVGREVKAWRNHMYMHGSHTDHVLRESGIDICSDGVDIRCPGPRQKQSGLWEFPINIIPDHEHLFHAERTPRWVRDWVHRYRWSDDFGSKSYYIDQWAEIVIRGIEENESRGRDSMMIIHPITMYLCDGFSALKRILKVIARYETGTISEIVAARSPQLAKAVGHG
jgi:hypothetical protein